MDNKPFLQTNKDKDILRNVSIFFRLSLERNVLLKQQLSKMGSWLTKAERKMEKENKLGPNFETVKKQLDEHQVITA